MRRDDETSPVSYEPGDYGRYHGRWFVMSPNSHIGDVTGHQVVEHEDRTITVSPSIRISDLDPDTKAKRQLFHGWLERGVWRNA